MATIAVMAVLLRLAWLGDDCYITLRTVENFCTGHGLVWNLDDRVQTSAHPLWVLLLVVVRAVTGESYYTTIGLSALLAATTVYALFRVSLRPIGMAALWVTLVLTRGFSHYAICGLENPLSFVLLVAFGSAVIRDDDPQQRCRRVSLLASLIVFARLDLAVLVAPAVLVCTRGLTLAQALRQLSIGALPLIGWLAFAVVYYATPFPSVAYAKAFHGIAAADLAQQGLWYLQYAVMKDPVLVAVTLAGTAVAAATPSLRARALALGIALYCAYLVRIGGDFMSTRFLSAPFVLALVPVARLLPQLRVRTVALCSACVIALGLGAGRPKWTFAPSDEPAQTSADEFHGIVDERAFYYVAMGLFSPKREVITPGIITIALREMKRTTPTTAVVPCVGRFSYESGELVHIIDPWLCDPLLMRLPVDRHSKWRIGHFSRSLPIGYPETVARGVNRIHHPGLARYYDTLRAALSEPVFSASRWRAMWRLWTGACDADLAAYVAEEYHDPPRIVVDAADLSVPLPSSAPGFGPFWFDHDQVRVVAEGGFGIRWPQPFAARNLRIQALGDADCLVRFLRGGETIGSQPFHMEAQQYSGLKDFDIAVPSDVGAFDTVWLDFARRSSSITAIGSIVAQQ